MLLNVPGPNETIAALYSMSAVKAKMLNTTLCVTI